MSVLSTTSENGRSRILDRTMLASIILLVLALVVAFYGLLTEGHAAFNTSSSGVNWGLPIATYVYFVLTSTGLTFVASLGMLFRFDVFYPIAKRCVWLAIATLIAGFAVLAMEIGHPFRMWWAFPTGLQTASPMFWMGTFYSLYLVFLLLKFQRIHAGDWHSGLSFYLGVASFLSVIVAHGNLGLIFGMMWMRPMWFDYMMPLYFLITAGVSGVAFAMFFTYLGYAFDQAKMPEPARAVTSGNALPSIFALVLGITIFMVVVRTISGIWSDLDGLQVYDHIVRSPLYHLELWVGLVLPFILMLSPGLRRKPGAQITAAALVMVAVFIGRYEFVINGQVVPVFKGTWVPGFVEYVPSLTEWMMTLFGIALVFVFFTLGEKFLSLGDSPHPVTAERGASEA